MDDLDQDDVLREVSVLRSVHLDHCSILAWWWQLAGPVSSGYWV